MSSEQEDQMERDRWFTLHSFTTFQGCIKFPTTWYSSPPLILRNLDFLPHNFHPLPLFSLDILHNSLDITGKIILHLSRSRDKFPSPPHNLIFFPNTLGKLPPPGPGGGEMELYTPLPPFDKNYRLLFPCLLLLFKDVSGWYFYFTSRDVIKFLFSSFFSSTDVHN